MTKAIRVYEHGGPEVLKWEEVSVSKPGKGEVVLKTKAVGLNFIDTYHRSGLYPVKLPTGIGLEGVGEIVEIGLDIKTFKVGDRVGYAAPPIGAYCELRDYPADKAFKIPDEINNDDAASVLLTQSGTTLLMERQSTSLSLQRCRETRPHDSAGHLKFLT